MGVLWSPGIGRVPPLATQPNIRVRGGVTEGETLARGGRGARALGDVSHVSPLFLLVMFLLVVSYLTEATVETGVLQPQAGGAGEGGGQGAGGGGGGDHRGPAGRQGEQGGGETCCQQAGSLQQ